MRARVGETSSSWILNALPPLAQMFGFHSGSPVLRYIFLVYTVWAYKTSAALLFVVLKSKSAVYDNLKEFNTFHNVLLLRSKFIEVKIPRDRRLPNWPLLFLSLPQICSSEQSYGASKTQ